MDILKEVSLMREELVEFRSQLHQIPEIAFEEYQTTEYIEKHLREWKISYKRLEPTGVIAFLGTGKKTIALRSDMDALSVNEETNLSFASKRDGTMHACGHDGHMAILLACAKVLKKYEKQLDKTVMLIFQPAEEIAQGAQWLIDAGWLDSVDEIFGLHIFSEMEAGKVSIESGPRMASTNWFSVTVEGQSGHAGKPHLCVDATVVAAAIMMNLQTIVSRNLNPIESVVITVGKLVSGTARNVISGQAVLEGTTRTFSDSVREYVKERICDIATYTAKQYGAKVSIDFPPASHGALENDPEVVEKARRGAKKVLKADELIHVDPMMLGEDYANYLTRIKGAFAFVGGGSPYPNHHSKFDLDPYALEQGMKLMLAYVEEA